MVHGLTCSTPHTSLVNVFHQPYSLAHHQLFHGTLNMNFSVFVCVCVCARARACVPRYYFPSYSSCEIQYPYILLLQTISLVFHTLDVGSPWGDSRPHMHMSASTNTAPTMHAPLQCTKTHIACTCALPLPSAQPMHPCRRRGRGQGLRNRPWEKRQIIVLTVLY